jgi:hypothetical protein
VNIKIHKTCIRTIREDDSNWKIVDRQVVSPRAGFEISEHCPDSWKNVILDAIRNGYLKPVAYMKDSELMWETLSNDNGS